VRQLDALERVNVSIVAARKERCSVFAGAVPRHDRGLSETRNKECAGSVALVMFEKVKLEIAVAEVFPDTAWMPQHAEITLTDLSDAKNLIQEQLDQACGNADTKLPEGLTLKVMCKR